MMPSKRTLLQRYVPSYGAVLALFTVGDVYASLCKKALTLHLARSESHERHFWL